MIQITDDPSAERTAPPRSTHVWSGDVYSFLIKQGGGEVDGDPVARRRGGGSSGIPAGLRQAQAGRKRCHGREAPGLGVLLPCASPLYIGVEVAGFLPSKSIGALAKVGGKKSHHFPSPPIVIPLFRDLDLIPLGYDLIPSKGGSCCTLTRGVGPCPHYPRSCGSPMQVGPTPEPSRTFPVQYRKILNIFRWPK